MLTHFIYFSVENYELKFYYEIHTHIYFVWIKKKTTANVNITTISQKDTPLKTSSIVT